MAEDESTHPGHGSMVLHALMMVAGFRLGTLCPVDTQGSALENLQQTLASATLAARREVEAGK